MAPTPSPRSISGPHQTLSRTPQSNSKHRLHFPNPKNQPPCTPLSTIREPAAFPTEHPVEVIGRIRDHPDHKTKPVSALEIATDNRSIRIRTDIGYRDFSLDGVSLSETEDLEDFYKKFVASRIEGVRVGAKCTIMMYGPTGSGKSHTMFGFGKHPGIVYRALRDILGEGDGEGNGEDDGGFGMGLFVRVAVLEIYNEEIYDLLSGNSNGGAAGTGQIPKGSNTPKVRLEVMGKKAKNAMYISGNEAGKISKEVAKVEKRRIVKSTHCNERSSRSHCLIILDVPSVGGRLMLVDMAGSENIEQAGQTGFEAKMQTAKINQGNTALKRVVESIANGDSHVPFRDSKLTMLLQDSFEDDKSKILMILCASPDPKEMHKTISTLEYGAKAKCIVRVAHMPTPKDKTASDESSSLLRSRIVAMNQFICKLQMDNKLKEKECKESHKELQRKEEELLELRSKLKVVEGRDSALKEEEIKFKVDERTQLLRLELMKMEEKMLQQQEQLDRLRQRLEEMECEKGKVGDEVLQDVDGGRFVQRLSEIYGGDQGMEKSMELDMGDQPIIHDVKEITEDRQQPENYWNNSQLNDLVVGVAEELDANMTRFPDRVCLSTVFEGDEEGEDRESTEEVEVDKEVVEENIGGQRVDNMDSNDTGGLLLGCTENSKDNVSDRKTRIQNIFRLCGNYREVAHKVVSKKGPEDGDTQSPLVHSNKFNTREGSDKDCIADVSETENSLSQLLGSFASLHLTDGKKLTEKSVSSSETLQESKENRRHGGVEADGMMDVYVKWEASKEFTGNFLRKLKVLKDSTLSDLRKLIEMQLEEDNNKQPFIFLLLKDPSGAPVVKEKEGTVQVSKLPICNNNQLNGHLACLRPKAAQRPNPIPFSSLENTIHTGLRV